MKMDFEGCETPKEVCFECGEQLTGRNGGQTQRF